MKDIVAKFIPQNFNDFLAVFAFLILIPSLWVWGDLSETVEGATIVTWVLIGNFYYRRRKPSNENGES